MVYRARFGEFCSVANAIVRDRERAKDAVQEAVASALANRHRWRGRGSLDAWLWRAVVNAARDQRRKDARVLPTSLVNGTREPATNAREPEQPELRSALRELPERQRLVVFLRYFGDLPYEAIAEILGVTSGTVAATLHQAQESLRRGLEVHANE